MRDFVSGLAPWFPLAMVFALFILVPLGQRWFESRHGGSGYTHPGATAALTQVQDWTKWMAGIQTAALAGLALVLEKFSEPVALGTAAVAATAAADKLPPQLRSWAIMTVVSMAAALFCSSWVLSSLAYVAQAIAPPNLAEDEYNIFKRPLYSWSPIRLGEMLTLQHWFWAIGIVSFGVLLWLRFPNP